MAQVDIDYSFKEEEMFPEKKNVPNKHTVFIL